MSSNLSWKSGDGVSHQFPAGLRVLVVDDDPTCLMILERMLMNCRYDVTKCSRAEIALSLLRENKNGFDIVISDVHMPDMDGFKLLEHIGLEMDLPVIMMSADDGKNVVMKGVTHGACDYLIKPVRIEALKNIWQHVVRRKKHEWKEFEQVGSVEDGEQQQKPPEDADYSSSVNEGNWRNSKKRKEEEEEAEDTDDTSALKKQRVVWSVELHQQFVAAVNQLGIDKSVPKKILELMNVPGLTRENVASHLQKYRLYLRRLSGVSQHNSGLNNSFMGSPESPFGSISSLNGLDLQALAATGQLSAQSLATLQAAALGRSTTTKSSISMSLVDKRNLFSFESPKLRFEDGPQQPLNNNSKQMNMLQGIPTNMEPKQGSNLNQSAQSFGGMNMQLNSHMSQGNSLQLQMPQRQSMMQMPNETNGSHLSRLGQHIMSNGSANGILAQNKMVDSARGTLSNPVSEASSMFDFSMNHDTDFPGSSFRLGSNLGISSLTTKRVLQEEVNSERKQSKGFLPSYDILNELHQQKTQVWGLQNVGLTYDASQHANMRGSPDVAPSVLVQQGFSSTQNCGKIRNAVGKAVFSAGKESGYGNNNAFLADNSLTIKIERLPDANYPNTLFPEQFDQEDLMSVLLKQHQEGTGPVESVFGFDGHPLDNLPV